MELKHLLVKGARWVTAAAGVFFQWVQKRSYRPTVERSNGHAQWYLIKSIEQKLIRCTSAAD